VKGPLATYSSLASASPASSTGAVGEEDGYRVVVGLAEELAGRQGYDVLDNSTRRHRAPWARSGVRGGAGGAIVTIAQFGPGRLQRKHLI